MRLFTLKNFPKIQPFFYIYIETNIIILQPFFEDDSWHEKFKKDSSGWHQNSKPRY